MSPQSKFSDNNSHVTTVQPWPWPLSVTALGPVAVANHLDVAVYGRIAGGALPGRLYTVVTTARVASTIMITIIIIRILNTVVRLLRSDGMAQP